MFRDTLAATTVHVVLQSHLSCMSIAVLMMSVSHSLHTVKIKMMIQHCELVIKLHKQFADSILIKIPDG
jgi:hypothetical protein